MRPATAIHSRKPPARWSQKNAIFAGLVLYGLLGDGVVPTCWAVLVGVEYRDQTLSQTEPHGGPLWEGVVDTTADTLSIYYWAELPGHGEAFWRPDLSSGPLVWDAVDVNGLTFDVPDTFGSSGEITIDNNWGFLSPITANAINYLDGDYEIVSVSDYYPGWGAVRVQQAVGGGSQQTEFVYQVETDETSLPRWPIGPFAHRASLDATITVIPASLVSIPEPTPLAFWGFLTGAAACRVVWGATGRKRARRRRQGDAESAGSIP